MNQQVQILDGFEYVTQQQALKLLALAGGQIITCFVLGVAELDASAFYQHYQFDIEELLVQHIESESWTESGEILIQSSLILAFN